MQYKSIITTISRNYTQPTLGQMHLTLKWQSYDYVTKFYRWTRKIELTIIVRSITSSSSASLEPDAILEMLEIEFKRYEICCNLFAVYSSKEQVTSMHNKVRLLP